MMKCRYKEHDSFYDSAQWLKIRARVLRRDGYQCQESKRYCMHYVPANTVHHILPREVFPELELCDWNLISLSDNMHKKMHTQNGYLTERGLNLMRRTCRKQGLDYNMMYERYRKAYL